jgi:hypothetical protein
MRSIAMNRIAMNRITVLGWIAIVLVGVLTARLTWAEEVKVEGSLTKIEGQLITIMNSGQAAQMKIEPATKILMHGKPIESRELKVGQKVRAVGDRSGGQTTCTTLEVLGTQ